jgi:Ca2+:H+ antiporter
MVIFMPVGIVLDYANADPVWVFLASALSIVPLAGLMGDATEALSRYVGSNVGALLNAAMGNAPEVIIGCFALQKGLVAMVKASVTGTVLGNLLFGLGLAILVRGLKQPGERISFDLDLARLYGGLMILAAVGLLIPGVFNFSTNADQEISLHVAALLFIGYLASVVSLLTRSPVPSPDKMAETEEDNSRWSLRRALVILTGVTIGLAVMSEIMTDALGPASDAMGLTPLFAGIFLLAMVGNASELITAARFAGRGKLDLAIGVTVGGAAQTALFVVPLLVFFGAAIGQEMNLLFSRFELVAIMLTIYAITVILQAGWVRWAGGFLLILVYLMLGIGFFYAPANVH